MSEIALSPPRPGVLPPRQPITGATRLVGVMGWPVAHSLSPQMHNAAFAALGLDWAYVPFAVPPPQLAAAVAGLVALGFAGCNATVPHKTALASLIRARGELTPVAAAIGSVNTIVVRPDGSLLGDSTDGYGFLMDLRAHGALMGQWARRPSGQTADARMSEATDCAEAMSPRRPVIVIGAGGAARAVVYALAEAGARVAVVNRTVAAAEELCRIVSDALPGAELAAHPFPAALSALAADAGLIVNTTSLGLHGAADPLPWDPTVPFRPDQVVYDLIYHVRTPLLALAEAAGAPVAVMYEALGRRQPLHPAERR